MGSQLAIHARLLIQGMFRRFWLEEHVGARRPVVGSMLVLAMTLAVTSPALADKPSASDEKKAQVLVKKGLEAYAASDYGTAATAFEEAYQLAPSQQTLFAWAQAERLRGNCRRSLELFTRLLEGELTKENRNAVRTSMTECEGRLAAEASQRPAESESESDGSSSEDTDSPPENTSDSSGSDEASAPSEGSAIEPGSEPGQDTGSGALAAGAGPSDRESGPAWYKDPVGGLLTGTGVVGIGVGIGLYISARSAHDAAATAETYSAFADATDRAESRGRLAVISGAAGVVLLGAGVTWYVIRGSRSTDRATSRDLSFWWQPDGAGLGVAGRF